MRIAVFRRFCSSSKPLVRLEGRTISMGDPPKLLVNGLDLCVRPGDRWAVLGSNGSGKTTVATAMADQSRLHPPPACLFAWLADPSNAGDRASFGRAHRSRTRAALLPPCHHLRFRRPRGGPCLLQPFPVRESGSKPRPSPVTSPSSPCAGPHPASLRARIRLRMFGESLRARSNPVLAVAASTTTSAGWAEGGKQTSGAISGRPTRRIPAGATTIGGRSGG